jgi:hypothetical protein
MRKKIVSLAVGLALLAVTTVSLPTPKASAQGSVSCAHLAWIINIPADHVRWCLGGSSDWYGLCTIGGRHFIIFEHYYASGDVGRGYYEAGAC